MCKVTHTQGVTHCDSHNHTGENVSLFVKQKSLTESISRQGEWRILDSIKLTASPIGAPLTGPLFSQTVCFCVFERKRKAKSGSELEKVYCMCVFEHVRESVCVRLSWGWTHFSPSALRSASSVRDLVAHKHSQNLIPPSAVPTEQHTLSPQFKEQL